MVEPLANMIIRQIAESAELYHRLVLVVAPAGGGKTVALQAVAQQTSASLISVSLEVSKRLIELTQRQRSLQLPRILGDLIAAAPGDVILLDNIEVLFDASLKLDPLRCLQSQSRNRTLVVAWNGTVCLPPETPQASLTFSTPDHPEYRRYPAHDLKIVTPQ